MVGTQRRQIARLANGKLIYEPRVSISPAMDNYMKTAWLIRIRGQIAGGLSYRNRADALKAARSIARHLATGDRVPCEAF